MAVSAAAVGPTAPGEAATGVEGYTSRPGLALLVIMCVQLMSVLDVTVVNVALPSIYRGMGFSVGNLEWLVAAYAVTSGGMLIFGGRAGDLYGRRRVFMAGVALFASASLLAGSAQTQLWLMFARGAQGAGAAIASPTALSLVAANFPEGTSRDRAVGIWATVSGAGGAVGLLLGGVLTAYGSWRWIFYINVPFAALALILAPRVLKESKPGAGKLDIPGTITVTVGMIALVYGLIDAATRGWSNPQTYGPILAAVLILVLFAGIERAHPHPLIPRGLLADPDRVSAYGFMLALSTSIFSVSYFLTLYLQDIHRYSPIRTGLAFLPMALGVMAAAFATSRVLDRTGIRPPLLSGPVTAIAGLLWLTRLTPATGYLELLGPLCLLAVGLGQCFVPLTATVLAGVDDRRTGVASALLSTAQQIGGAVGLAVLGTVAATTTRNALPTDTPSATQAAVANATTHGYTIGFAAAAVLVAVALGLAITRFRNQDVRADPATTVVQTP
jgi:EmrB/QacA subfamily drug resistance transporter